MRWNASLFSLALAASIAAAGSPAVAATFGGVVPIGGHASDIALDESRGVLYIANFTANRIEVMSLADGSIRTSMNVAPQPGAISLSPDNKQLIVAHFGNITPADPSRNAITLINLDDNTRQTFTMGDTPLGVQFLSDGTAFIATNNALVLFDPLTGAMNVLSTLAGLANQLPTTPATFPSQVINTQLATTSDRNLLYGLIDDGNSEGLIRYNVLTHEVHAESWIFQPKALPRVSVSADGATFMVGQYKFGLFPGDANFWSVAYYPNAVASATVGGHAIDSNAGIMYIQIPKALTSSTSGSTSQGSTSPAAAAPVLQIVDADNFTVREQLYMPENITGRSVLNAAADVMYSVSDSGVMILPVGRINQAHRLALSQRDVVAQNNFCNKNVLVQTMTITDPGGGSTDFSLSTDQSGVSISPASGVTPATVQVRVDPNAFQNQNGTVAVTLTVSSTTSVNVLDTVRVLVNNHNPDQRGTSFDIPGVITDVLADPIRDRFYVVQQDRNLVLVFDGSSYKQLASLRTSTVPTRLAMTPDRKYLMVGHDSAQLVFVYDLDTLQTLDPILFRSHNPKSIAESGGSILALSRDINNNGWIDRIDFAARRGTPLPTLGIYTNGKLNPNAVLVTAPNGGTILYASPDGNVMLYDATADTFTAARKDVSTLSGAVAASSYNTYVVGNYLLNASLVQQATLESASGASSGFAFVDQWGFRTTAASSSSPGVIQRVDPSTQSLGIRPTRMIEAPLTPPTTVSAATSTQAFYRSVAPLYSRSAIIALTVSGFTVLPWNYDAAVAPPKIATVVNAADGTQPVAPGGLISVYGQQMAPVNLATKEIPLPTALGDSCLTVNGVAVPMLFVSSTQINGQLPFNVDGRATMTLRTPGGISDNFYLTINPAAPSIFRSGSAGPMTGLATVVRDANGEYVTPTNPILPNDSITIYATGLGRTDPPLDAGLPAPNDVLLQAINQPVVTLGGTQMAVSYAGLAPGMVGVYMINAKAALRVPTGLSIPLVIDQGNGASTTLTVRVVPN